MTALAAAQAPRELRLEGLDVRLTSGTLELNHVTASDAAISEDGRQIIAGNLMLEARTEGQPPVRATAPVGYVTIGGAMQEGETLAPTFGAIQDYHNSFQQSATYGDVLLEGTSSAATASLGEEGSLTSRVIIWSQRFGRVILPTGFRQESTLPGGAKVIMSGSALTVDRGFTQWTYFSGPDGPARIEYTAPSAEESTDAPSK